MKFTGFAISLAFTGIASAAAIRGLPGVEGTVAGVEGAAAGTLAGLTHGAKRQLGLDGTITPITESGGSTLNGATGITGSAVGTVGSTVAGAAGTAEKIVAGAVPCMFLLLMSSECFKLTVIAAVKRQLNALEPVAEGAGSSLNGVTGTAGSAVGTVGSTTGGAAGTAEKVVADTATGGLGGGLLKARQLDNLPATAAGGLGDGLLEARQVGNLPATLEQTLNYALIGISGSMSTKSQSVLSDRG